MIDTQHVFPQEDVATAVKGADQELNIDLPIGWIASETRYPVATTGR